MSTYNIGFCGEIRKIFTGYPPLSRPMYVESVPMQCHAKLYKCHMPAGEALLMSTTTYVFGEAFLVTNHKNMFPWRNKKKI